MKAIEQRIQNLKEEIEKLEKFNLDVFFDKLSKMGVVKFHWKQYSPYFNDGEACEFSVHDEPLDIEFEDGSEFGDSYDLYDGSWDNKEFAHPNHKAFYEFDFLGELGLSEGACEDCFGNHVRVYVDVKNRDIYTEEYTDHD